MNEEYTVIYKSKYYNKKHKNQFLKVLVFDLDETIGDFKDLELIWNTIQHYTPNKNNFNLFKELLDLYPEFLRFGIISILEFLHQKKKEKVCHSIYIYTNNQAPPKWITMIIDYLDYKLNLKNSKLFDQIIHTFKVRNKQIELKRTTHKKTWGDFINCTLLPRSTEICFVDNTNFETMKEEKIYYIQPMSYYHHLSASQIVNRFLHSKLAKNILKTTADKKSFERIIFQKKDGNMLTDSENNTLLKTNILVSQKIMYHIRDFFFYSNKREKTKKNKKLMNRLTRKKL